MRVLLDENIPADLAVELTSHEVTTVSDMGWEGTKNGELLRRATGNVDALITMDRNLEFQQPLAKQSFGVVLVIARSNRMSDLMPLLPAIMESLVQIRPGELRRVGA